MGVYKNAFIAMLFSATVLLAGTYRIYNHNNLRLDLKTELENESSIPVFHNGERVDNPDTPEEDLFAEFSLRFPAGRGGGLNFTAGSYWRFGLTGELGSHYQGSPNFSTEKYSDLGPARADTIKIFSGDQSKYNFFDVVEGRFYIGNEDSGAPDTVAYGESYFAFKDDREIDHPWGKFIFEHKFVLRFTQDYSINPNLQGLGMMNAAEGVNDHETIAWDSPDGTVQSFDVYEEEWFAQDVPGTKYFEIDSFYEVHSLGNDWMGVGPRPGQWRVKVTELGGVAEGSDLFLKLHHKGRRFKDGEEVRANLLFSMDPYIDVKAGDSLVVVTEVTNDVEAYPWDTLYHHGFEDSLEHWIFSNGVEYLPDTGAAWIEWTYNDGSIIPTWAGRDFTPGRYAEGVAAIKMISTGIEQNAIVEMNKTLPLAGATQVRLSYWFKTIDFDASDTLIVEHNNGNGVWQEVEKVWKDYPVCEEPYQTNNIVRHSYAYAKNGKHNFTNESRFRFRLISPTAGHHLYLDDIDVYAIYKEGKPALFMDRDTINIVTEEEITISPLRNDINSTGSLKITNVTSSNLGNNVSIVSDSTIKYVSDRVTTGFDTLTYTTNDGVGSASNQIIVFVTTFNDGSNVYQAEEASLSDGAIIRRNIVDIGDNWGGFIEYEIWVPKDTVYTLNFYAQGPARYQHLIIDSTERTDSLLFTEGDKADLSVPYEFEVLLARGLHTIEIRTGAASSGAVEHDKLVITGPIEDWGEIDGDMAVSTINDNILVNSTPISMQVIAGKLHISGNVSNIQGINIYNIRGQRIELPGNQVSALRSGASISLDNLSSGVYLIEAISKNRLQVVKFLK